MPAVRPHVHLFDMKAVRMLSVIGPWIVIGVVAMLYWNIIWVQYENFRNGIDLGTYTQILYNLASFHHFPPYNSILGQTAWGDHAHFIMAVLAPLFALYPHDITTLIIQLVAITTSAWAIYAIAQKRFHNYFYSYAILIAYLLFFGVQYALAFDFHANVLTASFLAWLFYAYETKRTKMYWTMLILVLLTREDASLFAGAFGTYAIFAGSKKEKIVGAITLGISLVTFFAVNYAIMPMWEPHKKALAYFDVDQRLLLHPVKMIENMTDSSVKIRTMRNLFGSFGLLSLASPFTYLTATPNLIARFLSPEQQRWDMKMHYSASLVSIISYGAILGTAMIVRIVSLIPRIPKQKTMMIVTSFAGVLLLITTYTVSFHDIDMPLHQLALGKNAIVDQNALAMRPRLESLLKTIPQHDSVSTISAFVPFFSTRESITKFTGNAHASADWVILSNQFVSWPLSNSEINTAIHEMRQNQNYIQVESSDNLFVFKKQAPASAASVNAS